MCGIVGFVGRQQAAPVLLQGLSKLEYRGYDSAGIAVFTDKNNITVEKCKGRLKVLEEKVDGGKSIKGEMGIGHTRWATHGEPNYINSHPHVGGTNGSDNVAVVHNGIIENYIDLKKYLQTRGYNFVSDTDTEVVAQLVDYFYQSTNGNSMEAVKKTINKLEGSFALGIMFNNDPEHIYAVRKDSPLIVGLAKIGNFIASDIPAILPYTRNVYLLEDKEIVVLTKDNVAIYNIDGEPIKKEVYIVDWDVSSAEKGGYEHFMFKEIMEQPDAITETISPRIKNGQIVLDDVKLTKEDINNLDKIYIVACGSAYHVGVVGKYIIESQARIPVEVDLASEFRYRSPIITKNTLVVIISQSGETLDTLCALREAKRLGARILSIVNVVGSSIARESDDILYTWAGPEIAVATTKAYSTQLSVVYLLSQYLAQQKGEMTQKDTDELLQNLQLIPAKIQDMLKNCTDIQYLASKFYNAKDIFFIGRSLDYAIGLEGSLKLKEISYIHSEAYAAGELKHGPISLIEDGTLVIALATQPRLYDKLLSNIKEVKARGAVVLAIVQEGMDTASEVADYVITIPKCDPLLAASLAVVPLQLFGYYVAAARGCDVDKPRNLAKSVTVE
ncbi:MAG: glutamine--fructose-6-phosphate transaminase (isomerizing) [Clostridiales bacterium]|jgi:glucosamine--fructose-6-phosphate aminotransferase (isomerizing)|nr:glutamine--fructose-6-phosphate transaminase (isomerizing) [Clostridiales bacterium]